jgi:hypothetical protein
MAHQNHSNTAMHIDQPWIGRPYLYNTNYQCDPENNDSLQGGCSMGVTLWRDASGGGPEYEIPPNGNVTISFTGTKPSCYVQKDSCNIYFDPVTLYPGDTTGNDVYLSYILNGGAERHLCHISGVIGHPAIQGYDLAPVNSYNDVGLNTLLINNYGNATVELINFQVFRTYRMKVLGNECSAGSNPPANGTLDYLRNDYPCNLVEYGGRSLLHHLDPTYNNKILYPYGQQNDTFTWFFDWTKNQTDYNYVDKDICLFNFNQIVTQDTTTAYNDVRLYGKINGQGLVTFWLPSNEGCSSFPSYDLTKSPYYNDMGPNQVTLTNMGDVPVEMIDDLGVDVYRIYKTDPVHHDHADHTNVAHSDYTYGDFSDVAHSDVAHEDAEAHSDVSHSDTSHSDGTNHDNYVDWPYYSDSFGDHSDGAPHSDFSNHSDVSYSDTAHSDVGTGHSDYTTHDNYTDWPYYSDSFGDHSDGGPHSDHSDHSDAPPGGHADTPHSDAAHSDAGTYYDHDDTYPYPLPHVNYWGYPHSDTPHTNFNNHGDAN